MRLAPAGVMSSAISGRRGRQEDLDPRRVVDDEGVERLDVPVLELRDDVRDRLVLGVEVEQDADVAELERSVDEAGPLAELGGRGDREVDRERRASDAALGAEHRDDAPGLAVLALDLGPDRDGGGAAAAAAGAATAMRESFSCSRV